MEISTLLSDVKNAFDDSVCLLLLGGYGEVCERSGEASSETVTFVQSVAAVIPDTDAGLSLVSARCIIDECDRRIIIFHLKTGVSVVAIGPPGWNVPLAERAIQPIFPIVVGSGMGRRESDRDVASSELPVRDVPASEEVSPDWYRDTPGIDLLERVLTGLDRL